MKTRSAYEIDKEYENLFQNLLDLSHDNENDNDDNQKMIESIYEQITLNEQDFKEKSINILKFLKTLEANNDFIKAEKKRLDAFKKTNESIIDRLEKMIINSLNTRQLNKLDLGIFKLSIREGSLNAKELSNLIDNNLEIESSLRFKDDSNLNTNLKESIEKLIQEEKILADSDIKISISKIKKDFKEGLLNLPSLNIFIEDSLSIK